MRWALSHCGDLAGAAALDVGTGIGRWSRWLAAAGAQPVSVDLTRSMLAHAVGSGAVQRPIEASARALPFATASFDAVLSVTVIQHMRPPEQESALAEIGRVSRPGGLALLLELIAADDMAPHVFPRPPQWWISRMAAHGLRLIAWRGQEYLPVERLLRVARQSQTQRVRGSEAPRSRRLISDAKLAARGAMYLAEPLWRTVLPNRLARHGVFVFRKEIA